MVHWAIRELVHRSWWNLDRDGGEGGEAMFTADATLVMPARTMRGRSEIKGGIWSRQQRGPRVSRHLVSNLMVTATDTGRATALYVLLIFAKDGSGPQVAASYQAVCDVEDELVLEGEGWLIHRREVTAVFVAPDNDSVLLARNG